MLSLLPLLFVAALPVEAAVYKCANDKGGVIYQDTACAPGKELRNLEVDPAPVNVVPATPGAKAPPAPSAIPARPRSSLATVNGASAAERKYLQAGMTEAEVIRKVGRADLESEGRSKDTRRWAYLPTAGDPDTVTTLTFAGGKVASVERKAVH